MAVRGSYFPFKNTDQVQMHQDHRSGGEGPSRRGSMQAGGREGEGEITAAPLRQLRGWYRIQLCVRASPPDVVSKSGTVGRAQRGGQRWISDLR